MAHNLSPRFDTAGFPHIICIYAKYASAKDSFGPYDASQAFGASFCRHANNIRMAEEHPARSLKEAKSKTSPRRTRRKNRGHGEEQRKIKTLPLEGTEKSGGNESQLHLPFSRRRQHEKFASKKNGRRDRKSTR